MLVIGPTLASPQDATTAARAFFEARARRDWPAMVHFVDSAGVATVRGRAREGIELVRTYDAEAMRAQLAAVGAEAPLKVLEASREMVGGGSLLRTAFAGVTDTLVLQGLSDSALVARWLEAKDPSYLTGLLFDGMLAGILALAPDGGVQPRQELEAEMRTPVDWSVVGVVEEPLPRALAHVTYRMTAGGPTGVLTFRRLGARWYLWLDGEEQLDAVGRLEMAARKMANSRR